MQEPESWAEWRGDLGRPLGEYRPESEQVIGGTVEELSQEVYTASCLDYNDSINNNEETNMIERLEKSEELALIESAQTGNRSAQARLLEQYERLCHKQARKYAFTAPNHDHDDLVQEGRIGLLQAIRTFDPTVGASFMTWAFYHVRGAVAGSGRVDRKQPRFPYSVEDCPRAYNIEDPSQEIVVRDEVSTDLVRKVIEACCGGLHTKRASIVMDRFGLLGRKELRNCECATKYGLTKYAINSHTYQFKIKARRLFPELAELV